jgi:glycosyltransferase involved in cell wall biosynthesis
VTPPPDDLGGATIAIVNWRDPWHPQAGGAERYAWEMARGLAARHATVLFLTARAPAQARRERRDGIEIVRLGGRFTVYPLVLSWLLLGRLTRRRRWDAVLDCQNGIPFFTPCVLPRRVPVFCVVHHVHTSQFALHLPGWLARAGRLLEGPVARLVYRRHTCVAVSPSTVTAMRSRLRWKGDIQIIPNGTVVPAVRPIAPDPGAAEQAGPPVRNGTAVPVSRPVVPASGAAEQPGPPIPNGTVVPAIRSVPPHSGAAEQAEPLRLVWVGRLVAHKRPELILPVAERLGGAVVIDVIGRGQGEPALAAAIARCGLAEAVRLRGFLPEADRDAIVARSVLHLNTSQGEGWGLCVLEAAALGVPTVAYDVEGLRDAVRDGTTGWLVRDGEPIEDVVERALKELGDPARRAAVAAACRHWAAQFNWESSTVEMARLVRAALDRRAP